MGWLYRKCSKQDLINDLLADDFGPEWERKVLAHAVRGNVLWTVNQISNRNTGGSDTFIGCDLLQKDGEWWGYKGMDESMGPCYYTCPLKYLSLAPERNPQWRQKVREHHARRGRRFSVGQQVALIGCTIPWVRIISVNPLQGEYQGTRYRLNRAVLGEVMQEPDGQDMAIHYKPTTQQAHTGI